MGDNCSRRDFLRLSAAALAVPTAGGLMQPRASAAEAVGENLTAYQVGPHVWVRWNNHLLTSYRAHHSQKYPYFYPLTGPLSGVSLTSETSVPYPHHRSLLFACDHVNGGNYWQGDFAAGQIFSDGPTLGEAMPDSVEIIDRCEWHKPDQPTVMTDDRKFTVSVPSDRLRLIDAEIKLTAVEDITVTKTNHSLFAIRAAADIAPVGGGTLLNSEGASGEKATFGKPADWCTYFGARKAVPGGIMEGIALMNHPDNPFEDCPWFTRDYGFISPTPLNFINQPWQLPAGESVELKYRVVMYGGTPDEADLREIFSDWVGG